MRGQELIERVITAVLINSFNNTIILPVEALK